MATRALEIKQFTMENKHKPTEALISKMFVPALIFILLGGLDHFLFSPYIWNNHSQLTNSYFSDGFCQPPTSGISPYTNYIDIDLDIDIDIGIDMYIYIYIIIYIHTHMIYPEKSSVSEPRHPGLWDDLRPATLLRWGHCDGAPWIVNEPNGMAPLVEIPWFVCFFEIRRVRQLRTLGFWNKMFELGMCQEFWTRVSPGSRNPFVMRALFIGKSPVPYNSVKAKNNIWLCQNLL